MAVKQVDKLFKIEYKREKMETIAFHENNPKLPILIANRYGLSVEGIHRVLKRDSNQMLHKIKGRIKKLQDDGHEIKLFAPNGEPVFACYINRHFDHFGFFKVIIDGEVSPVTFGQRDPSLFSF